MILDKNGYYLDVFSSYFLTQKDDLLPSLNTGIVVRHVHDLQLLLGLNQWLRSKSYHMIVTNLSIKDWMWHHRVQHHCIFTRTCRILQKCLVKYIKRKIWLQKIFLVNIFTWKHNLMALRSRAELSAWENPCLKGST